jgi:hypothetical protein
LSGVASPTCGPSACGGKANVDFERSERHDVSAPPPPVLTDPAAPDRRGARASDRMATSKRPPRRSLPAQARENRKLQVQDVGPRVERDKDRQLAPTKPTAWPVGQTPRVIEHIGPEKAGTRVQQQGVMAQAVRQASQCPFAGHMRRQDKVQERPFTTL